MFIERRFLKISRWTSFSRKKGLHHSFIVGVKSSMHIDEEFIGDDGKTIKVVGDFEFIEK